jgi:hypothetical protein
MNRKLVLLGLIFLIPMMLSGCLLPPGGFVVNDHPHGDYYQHRDQHHDPSYQQGRRGHRR